MPLADNSESKVFWMKMIADFYRYQAESCLLLREVDIDVSDDKENKKNKSSVSLAQRL